MKNFHLIKAVENVKKHTLLILLICALAMCMDVQAAPVVKYTTKKVALRAEPKGKIIYTVKRGTKVKQIKAGKWCKVKYKGKNLYIKRKNLTSYKPLKAKYSGSYFKRAGVIHWKGMKYTWYSARILPDPHNRLGIKGKHIDEQGFICDKDNFIVLGSSVSNRGKIVKTPFGKWGKVYDAGYVGAYWFDCYVAW